MYDSNGQFYSTTKVYGYIKRDDCKFSYKFLLGLMNSHLFWFFIQNTGYILRGGYYTFKTNYVMPFPIPNFEECDKSLIIEIENLVQVILELKRQNQRCEILSYQNEIDERIYQLYGFANDEINIIRF